MLTRIEFPKNQPARSQSEKNKTRDDGNENDHPVLEVEAQNERCSTRKCKRPRAPIFRAE
jgi:hypothetical protein